jgi:hypothetical protein
MAKQVRLIGKAQRQQHGVLQGLFVHRHLEQKDCFLIVQVSHAAKDDLVLVKGGSGSRLFRKAYQISAEGRDRTGDPLKVLSPKLQKVFGDFGGHVSIQRSPPRWVEPRFVARAIRYLKGLA